MAMWAGDNNIPDDVLFEDFPKQCFPDIDGLTARLTATGIHICGEDSDWALQSDISLAVGPGCMIFLYQGEPRIEVVAKGDTCFLNAAEVRQNPSLPLEDVRLIRRGSPWLFSFAASRQEIFNIYADVIGISWKAAE